MALVAAIPGCRVLETSPVPEISSLVVRNHGFLDVNVYAMPTAVGLPTRLLTVVGSGTGRVALHRDDLQPAEQLVVYVRVVGANTSWMSEPVTVGDGLVAVLDVYTDAFGDCSRSNLHTVFTSEKLPAYSRH